MPRVSPARFGKAFLGELAPGHAGVEIDWPRYFRDFCAAHGGNPVAVGGKDSVILLFADGWTHSATDHAGPEWPPPDDPEQLRKLKLLYWQTRRQMVSSELTALERALRGLEQLCSVKSTAPIHLTVRKLVTDESTGAGRIEARSVRAGPDLWKGRIEFLRGDLALADRNIKEHSDEQVPDDQGQGAAAASGVHERPGKQL